MKRLLLLLPIITIFLCSCNDRRSEKTVLKNVEQDQKLLSGYFEAATHGVISAGDELVYVFKTPIDSHISTEELNEIITLYPKVEGTTTFSNGTVLKFVPKNLLTPDENYKVSLNLSKLKTSLPSELEYNVRTFKQEIKVSRDGIIVNDDQTISVLLNVATADKVDKEKLKNCFETDADEILSSTINDNNYQIELIYSNRLNEKSYVKYDAKSIGAESKGELTFKDFDIDKFTVLTTRHSRERNEFSIYFSQRLDGKKDLQGLVQVNGTDAKMTIKHNQIIVYTSGYRNSDKVEIKLSKGLKSITNETIENEYTFHIENTPDKPSVEFVTEGLYFPSGEEFRIPIKVRALDKVRVTVVEIKQKNVHHYLAWHSLQYSDFYNLRMFGKPMYDEVVNLNDGIADDEGWKVFGIDLSKSIQKNPGSIYNISLSIEPSFVSLSCKDQLLKYGYKSKVPTDDFFSNKNHNFYYNNYYYDYDWSERNNPCHISYYMNMNLVQRNFICSNYSAVVKRGGNNYHVALTDLVDLSEVQGGRVSLYDLQGEEIINGTTSGQGFCKLNTGERQASVIQIEKGNHITFMSLDDAMSNPLTEFNISGDRTAKDGQFFIYSERDVWRPGDSIYVNVMINRDFQEIPKGLPIKMEFLNTENLIIDEQRQNIDLDRNLIYNFVLKTSKDAKSGMYRAVFEIGTQRFHKNIRIENIKPNTAEVMYSFESEEDNIILSDKVSGTIHAQYLTGFALKGAKVKTEALCRPVPSFFSKYKDFSFNDYKSRNADKFQLFSVTTDGEGEASFESDFDLRRYNGPVRVYLETETVLSGGGINKEGKSAIASPYKTYIGAKRDKGSGWRTNYLLNENPKISLISIDQKGNIHNGEKKINYSVQKHRSHWWIDKYRVSSRSYFKRDNYWEEVSTGSTTINGEGILDLKNNDLEKGAYRVLINDEESGHRTMVYFSVYNGVDRIPGAQPYIIEFETDKEEYEFNEDIALKLPKIEGAKALISIERSNKVIDQLWYNMGKEGDINLTIQDNWSPNIYIHVTMLQPYLQDDNDLPLRMYGVKPIKINTKEKGLSPEVRIADKMESNTTYDFSVSEKNGKMMEYTIAFVDEGLLNLTGFSTPDPENHFNGKFPLLVKTWDIYKYLMMFFKGDYAGVFSVGGDDTYKADAMPEVNRFKSVVKHYGPFVLEANEEDHHLIEIPNYIGKLRMMVVACNDDKFGNEEKMISIKNPLMLQSQFPRALNVTDKLSLPITILRDDKTITTAELEMKTSEGFIKGFDGIKKMNFSNEDQKTEIFDIEVLDKAGALKTDIIVKSGDKKMTEKTEIAVNYPNAYETSLHTKIVPKDSVYKFKVVPKGYENVFESRIQVSGLKVPKFVEYAENLISYPYGCLEQTTSKGFGQLYLDKIMVLTPQQNRERLEHLQAVINKLTRFQRNDGQFKYWESGYYHSWSDLYAGNFLIELSNHSLMAEGSKITKRWINAQKRIANNWSFREASNRSVYEQESLIQAYRLFVLAKSGNPVKSAMNRFSSSITSENPLTWWLLSGAYILSGYETKANELLKKAEKLQKSSYRSHYYWSFGNKSRDLAIIVEILSYFNDKENLSTLYYNAMVDKMNESNWVNTHTMGYSFLAAFRYFGTALDLAKTISYDLSILSESNQFSHSSVEPKIHRIDSKDFGKQVVIKNRTDGKIFIYRMDRFIDNELIKEAKNANLEIETSYFNVTKGEAGLDNMSLGDDISITVRVRNLTAVKTENLALNLKMPSGWELLNPRMYTTEDDHKSSSYISQDYKDDRVYTFFNLKAGGVHKYHFKAKASYSGDFFMPAVICENMYDGDFYARTKSQRVQIEK